MYSCSSISLLLYIKSFYLYDQFSYEKNFEFLDKIKGNNFH